MEAMVLPNPVRDALDALEPLEVAPEHRDRGVGPFYEVRRYTPPGHPKGKLLGVFDSSQLALEDARYVCQRDKERVTIFRISLAGRRERWRNVAP